MVNNNTKSINSKFYDARCMQRSRYGLMVVRAWNLPLAQASVGNVQTYANTGRLSAGMKQLLVLVERFGLGMYI